MQRHLQPIPALGLALGLLLPALAAGHGATYQPPPPPLPGPGGTYHGPGDTTPSGPSTPAAPSYPGPGGAAPGSSPSTPGPSGPRTPAAPPPSGPPTIGSGPSTPGAGPATAQSDGSLAPTRWTWWWWFHQAPYLDLKRVIQGQGATGPRTGDFFGRGGPGALAASAERVRTEVVPHLLWVLSLERDTDLLSSALIALARVGDDLDAESRSAIADAVRPFLRDGNRELSEAAVLALGILGHEENASLLASLLRGDETGRQLTGQSDVPMRMRAFAAYSLGLLAGESRREDVRRYAVHQLAGVLDAERGLPVADLEAACVLALGLVPLPDTAALPEDEKEALALPASGSRAGQILFLRGVLLDKQRHDAVRCQAPLSLARLARAPGDTARPELLALALTELCARLSPMRREPNAVVQSAVVGIGRLADNDADPLDAAARQLLLEVDNRHKDQGAQRFARISLATAAARDSTGAAAGLDDVRRFLLRELARGSSEERAWSALALGVLERGRLDAGRPLETGVAMALREALSDARAPDEIGAAAVALGLMRDPLAEPVLLERLRDQLDDETRGYVALALGMVGARAAQPELERQVEICLYRPFALREAATGLVLLGDQSTLPRLQGMLREARSLASQAALAKAIGRVGDARAFGDLSELVRDRERPTGSRAFAVVALGLVGDLDPLPWWVPLSVDGNHLSAPPTLYDDVGLGVLNLL